VLGLQPGSVLLWDAYHEDDPQPLEDKLDSSLVDADIVHRQALLLEPCKRHRDWQVRTVLIMLQHDYWTSGVGGMQAAAHNRGCKLCCATAEGSGSSQQQTSYARTTQH
jgi:hypothetical protein